MMPEVKAIIQNGSSASSSPGIKITEREGEILYLLAQGRTGSQIAQQLQLSGHTIESHRKNIMIKMNARNTVHMVAMALKKGIIN